MKKFILVLLFFSCALPSLAEQNSPILGKWFDQKENGGMLVEFTETTMSFTPIDKAGNPLKAPQTAKVTYGGHDNIVYINMADGPGGFMAMIKNEDEMTLDVPGVMATNYKRLH